MSTNASSQLPPPPIPPPKLISIRFAKYDKAIRDIWESYHFHSFYLPLLHNLLKKENIPLFMLPSLGSAAQKKQKRKDTLGVISHILNQVTPQRSLIFAVSQTEAFLQYLVVRVLRDFPARLLIGSQSDQGARELKLLDIVLNSSDKWEMLEKIIEEKVRALFYGAPSDFFLKDKARLGFGDYFSKSYQNAVENYVEITARRNVLIHNGGRIDRKYLREVPKTLFTIGTKAAIDAQYLRTSLLTLRGLAAHAGVLVCERVYNDNVKAGSMLQRKKAFKP